MSCSGRTTCPTPICSKIVAIDCRAASESFSIALKAGADGFLTREAAPDDVVAAVRSVSRGQTYVSPAIVSRMVNTYVLGGGEQTPEDTYATLTDRERQVLLLAAVHFCVIFGAGFGWTGGAFLRYLWFFGVIAGFAALVEEFLGT